MQSRFDVLVVGAGPAGSAAAISAATRGLDVLLVDKATFPRDKTCGDGLTTGALRLLEQLGFPLESIPSYTSVRECVIVTPSSRRVTLPLPGNGEFAGVVPRAELDTALAEHAARRGAVVCDGNGITSLEVREEGLGAASGVVAELADGTPVEARWVIAADGHYSGVRHLLEPDRPPKLGDWSTFRQYFRGVDDRRLWVIFEPDLLPGYAWVFPLPDGRANVGFGMLRGEGRGGKLVKEKWNSLLQRPSMQEALGPAAEPDGPHRAWPVPTRLDPAALTRSRVLFVGDAAGVVDPMTGEGIAQALETGMLAAEAIRDGGTTEAVARRYRDDVAKTLGHDLAFARFVQRVLGRPWTAHAALRSVDLNDWTRRNFARWMFEDYPRAALLTPARWHRALLAPSGAYHH
jgi:geranylgeranyl reductase family protein